MEEPMRIRLAHSPDPDDAFMFYGLSSGAVDSGPYEFEHILEDIQTLNERAMRGEYEMTAISIHAYPHVADKYQLTACGSSMGDNYGPRIVTRAPADVESLRGMTIAVPGEMTTAFLALQLMLGKDAFRHKVVMFDEIPAYVRDGKADAGLVIHEGQLTIEKDGLHLVVDLGQWWLAKTDLPLPLGGNVVRRDLGPEHCRAVTRIMKQSIQYSLDHRAEAVKYALKFGRGLDEKLADEFVGMYVNKWTLDYGPRGREAVRRLLAEGAAAGLVPDPGPIEFVE
ncbi:MAG: ABC transporter substrate-binding protein [Planctomycetota bacterium]|nr:MAG: ABC transporter substrate-binding protein [Planctomycetota bacterium]